MLLGIGQGRSFPWLSSSTGRPAMVGSSAVETTGKGFCCCATVIVQRVSASTAVRNFWILAIIRHPK